jgi:predicted nucleic acid-binding Zn finger protein
MFTEYRHMVEFQMESAYQLENKLMEEAYNELESRGELSPRLRERLEKTFGERFTNGWKLANSKNVRKYQFKPSNRVVWVVQGRKNEYQVMPDIPFCYCDDYYFRVMDKKRGLCYHIIAQHVAEALNRYQKISKNDSQYSSITDRWRAREAAENAE